MTPEQWQRAREVLPNALELKPKDWPAFLDRACSSDDALRREVERLLSGSDEARSSFLQSSTFRIGLTPGAKLGDYEVQRLLSGSRCFFCPTPSAMLKKMGITALLTVLVFAQTHTPAVHFKQLAYRLNPQ